VIEPIYNEVSQALKKALSDKFDLVERRNDLEYIDDDDNDNEDNDDDDDEEDDEARFYPTLPPIYPSMKKAKPENRSLKYSRWERFNERLQK
jgi:hypothetical protein